MQSKGPTPSRAKRVTFDVWARSVCVHIITLMTFRLIVPSSCVFVKYLQDFCLFFLWNARVVDVFFVCHCQSLCPMWRLRLTHSGKAKKFALYAARWSAGATFGFSEGEVKRVSFCFFLFVVSIDRVLNVCFDVGTVFVESFSNCLSLFRFLTSSYNTILAYFLTVGALFISIISTFNKLVNWKLAPL